MDRPSWGAAVPPFDEREHADRASEQDVKGVVRRSLSAATKHDGDVLRSFVCRAVKLADELAAAIIDLRMRQGMTTRRFDASPLRSCWDKFELADYLLDPSAPESSLGEMRRYLVELAQNLLPRYPGEGSA